MTRHMRPLHALMMGTLALGLGGPASAAASFEEARIFIEYNSTDNDLGFHVFADAEQWKSLRIYNPGGTLIAEIEGKAAYGAMGLSELFFEGAEPTLDEFPVEDLFALFPEGNYRFVGVTVDGRRLRSTSRLSHAVPAGPNVSAEVDGDVVVIRWEPVATSAPGIPPSQVNIVGYQVIVDPFQVTLPASSTEVTLPREFVQSLAPGEHGFEVLAIDASGNQTITASAFETH